MIRFGGRTKGGKALIGLALSHENLRRLAVDEPILIQGEEVGAPGVAVMIAAGRYADEVVRQIHEAAASTGATVEELEGAKRAAGFDDSAGPLMPEHPLVVIESPFAASDPSTEVRRIHQVGRNCQYARRCMVDSLKRGEYPIASHLLYPGILRDEDPLERQLGIEAGHAWGGRADLTAVYMDRGISPGMKAGIKAARHDGRPIIERWLDRSIDKSNRSN